MYAIDIRLNEDKIIKIKRNIQQMVRRVLYNTVKHILETRRMHGNVTEVKAVIMVASFSVASILSTGTLHSQI